MEEKHDLGHLLGFDVFALDQQGITEVSLWTNTFWGFCKQYVIRFLFAMAYPLKNGG